MIDWILLIVAFFVNLANGFQDLGNSRTEIRLLSEILNSNANGVSRGLKKEEARLNRRFWHRWGFVTYGLMGIIFGATQFEKGIGFAIYFVLIFWMMRPVVFNPILGIGLDDRDGFFHLSSEKGSWDNFFKKSIGEKFYWFGCFSILVLLILGFFFEIWT